MAFNATQVVTEALAVTPSDSAQVSFFGLYVGGTGNVTVKTQAQGPSGTTVEFQNVPAGSILPVMVCMVMATGTTATEIVGFGPK